MYLGRIRGSFPFNCHAKARSSTRLSLSAWDTVPRGGLFRRPHAIPTSRYHTDTNVRVLGKQQGQREEESYSHRGPTGRLLVGGLALGVGLTGWSLLQVDETLLQQDSDTGSEEKLVSFNNAQESFSSKSTWELFSSLVVFKLCSIRPLVNNLERIMDAIDALHLTWASNLVMERTFFSHFCAGATPAVAGAVVSRLHGAGIGSVIDLSVEDDPEEGSDHAAFFDQVARRIMDGIDVASAFSGNFVAVKVTALTEYSMLHHISNVLYDIKTAVREKHDESGSGVVSWNDFVAVIQSMRSEPLSKEDIAVIKKDVASTGMFKGSQLFYTDALLGLTVRSPATRVLLVGTTANHYPDLSPKYNKNKTPEVTPHTVTDTEYTELIEVVDRLGGICEYGKKSGVRVMLDQEYYEIKPALDMIAWSLAKKYNKAQDDKNSDDKGPLVYNTYQCYLEETAGQVERDLHRYQRQGVLFGGKIVRGAYMKFERARARAFGLRDPINPDKAATDKSYDQVITHLFDAGLGSEDSRRHRHVCLMVASHNEHSVAAAVAAMDKRGISPKDGVVHFGQLLGMCDHVSYALGRKNYDVLKYCPFGELEEVMPYLIRRAVENSDILGGTRKEVALLAQELRRRWGL